MPVHRDGRALSGSRIFLLPDHISSNELRKMILFIRDHGATTIRDPFGADFIVVRLRKGQDRHAIPVTEWSNLGNNQEWNLNKILYDFTVDPRTSSRGIVVEEGWLHDSVAAGYPLDARDDYGKWGVRGMLVSSAGRARDTSGPSIPSPSSSRDPRLTRGSWGNHRPSPPSSSRLGARTVSGDSTKEESPPRPLLTLRQKISAQMKEQAATNPLGQDDGVNESIASSNAVGLASLGRRLSRLQDAGDQTRQQSGPSSPLKPSINEMADDNRLEDRLGSSTAPANGVSRLPLFSRISDGGSVTVKEEPHDPQPTAESMWPARAYPHAATVSAEASSQTLRPATSQHADPQPSSNQYSIGPRVLEPAPLREASAPAQDSTPPSSPSPPPPASRSPLGDQTEEDSNPLPMTTVQPSTDNTRIVALEELMPIGDLADRRNLEAEQNNAQLVKRPAEVPYNHDKTHASEAKTEPPSYFTEPSSHFGIQETLNVQETSLHENNQHAVTRPSEPAILQSPSNAGPAKYTVPANLTTPTVSVPPAVPTYSFGAAPPTATRSAMSLHGQGATKPASTSQSFVEGVFSANLRYPLTFYLEGAPSRMARIIEDNGGELTPLAQAMYVVLPLDRGEKAKEPRHRRLVSRVGIHPCARVVSREWIGRSAVYGDELLDPNPFVVELDDSKDYTFLDKQRAESELSSAPSSGDHSSVPLSRKRHFNHIARGTSSAVGPSQGGRPAPNPPRSETDLESGGEYSDAERDDLDDYDHLDDITRPDDIWAHDWSRVKTIIAAFKAWDQKGGKIEFLKRLRLEGDVRNAEGLYRRYQSFIDSQVTGMERHSRKGRKRVKHEATAGVFG